MRSKSLARVAATLSVLLVSAPALGAGGDVAGETIPVGSDAVGAPASGPVSSESAPVETGKGPERWGVVTVDAGAITAVVGKALADARPGMPLLVNGALRDAARAADAAGGVTAELERLMKELGEARLRDEMDTAMARVAEARDVAAASLLIFYDRPRLAKAHVDLAVARLDAGEDGRAALLEALMVTPALTLDPGRYSPSVIAVFEEVRAAVPAGARAPTTEELARIGGVLDLSALLVIEVSRRGSSAFLTGYVYDVVKGSFSSSATEPMIGLEPAEAAERLVAKIAPPTSAGGAGPVLAPPEPPPLGFLPDPVKRHPFYTRPLFWGVVGGVAAVTAGLVTLFSFVNPWRVRFDVHFPEWI